MHPLTHLKSSGPAHSWRPGRLARNAWPILVWMAVRDASQAVFVLLLFSPLGAEPYACLVTLMALAAFLIPTAGLGFGSVLLRDIATRLQGSAALIRSALRTWTCATALCMAATPLQLAPLLPGELQGFGPVAWLLVCSEITKASISEIVVRVWQALGHAGCLGSINTLIFLVKLLGLVAYQSIVPRPELAGSSCLQTALSVGIFVSLLALRLQNSKDTSSRKLAVFHRHLSAMCWRWRNSSARPPCRPHHRCPCRG